MTDIEAIICLLLLFMAVPDLCARLRRPALAYVVFVVAGVLLGGVVHAEVGQTLQAAGRVGFLLLCPNLTIVALAVTSLVGPGGALAEKHAWLLLTGVFLSVPAIVALPASGKTAAPLAVPAVTGRPPLEVAPLRNGST